MGALRVGRQAQIMPTQDSTCVQRKARLVLKVISSVTVLAAMSRKITRITEVMQTLWERVRRLRLYKDVVGEDVQGAEDENAHEGGFLVTPHLQTADDRDGK